MSSDPYHYRLIARAIALIESEECRHLPLEALADRLGLSAAHFQRVFTAWAGVSPKRFQQALVLGEVRGRLRAGESLEAVAQGAGLSGTGRLHDLFLHWEAMSPGAHASGGAGLELEHAFFQGPLGEMLAAGGARGLSGLVFVTEGRDEALAGMQARWPRARLVPGGEALRKWVEAAFARRGEVVLAPLGAPFQVQVWEALLALPEGVTTTYGALAEAVGRPRAARAVGQAVGANPIAWLIPCHRVLRGTGALGGYRWGLTAKRRLLALEAARASDGTLRHTSAPCVAPPSQGGRGDAI
ncbi:MAG: methylated-DNA--[protein]-cysteine S-methyltransferase [Rhodobacteraceae bacterium]|nr:methylated-DNA--[protein]-cysteine S-methyltransferase [Paracoccaceae bacterium]